MKAEYSTLVIPSAELGGENPLPMFRAKDPDAHIPYDETFSPQEADGLGKSGGSRILPYLVQDRYNRKLSDVAQPVMILENEFLKAVVLCNYGGRLYSLYDKEHNRELLFKNPVIQPANLAIRDAWLSGGIEWNIGQIGHTFTTCSPMFCAIVKADDGEEFVRIYEYERQKRLFWQVDMHLPSGSRQFYAYTRIVNDKNEDTPMYWWTTTAVTEDAKTRVFANAQRAMYSNPKKRCQSMRDMPFFPEISDKDLSYTLNLPKSNDFFLQTPDDEVSPWEASAYGDGTITYERSSSLLRYRKVFCWGDLPGGWRWKEFLSKPGDGSYIELQAGIGRSQMHGITMPPNSTWEFTMAMGGARIDPEKAHDPDWYAARDAVGAVVDGEISSQEIEKLHARCASLGTKAPDKVCHYGSGWGALEAECRAVPSGYIFPSDSMDSAQKPWLELLRTGRFAECAPVSYMTDPNWLAMLKAAPENSATLYQLGVMAAESLCRDTARGYFRRSAECGGGVWAYRALAMLEDDPQSAETLYDSAYEQGFPDVGFAAEYLSLLLKNKKYEKLLSAFEQLPQTYRDADRVLLAAVDAELCLGKTRLCDNGLFDHEFANIREGEIALSDLWYRWMAIKTAAEHGAAPDEKLLAKLHKTLSPPPNIDFRMTIA